ncbi:MAG: hypothetical protein ACE367_11180 [Acidimicrobiales bacterium]
MSDTQQSGDWWQASDGKWYPPQSHPDQWPAPPTDAPPPPMAPQPTAAAAAERPTTTAAFICGVFGAVIGLIPLLGILAIPLGLIAFVLGLMGWRRKPQRAKLARVSTVLGVVAVALGIIGVVIVNDAFDELEEVFDTNLDESPSSPADSIPEYGSDPDLDRLADACAGTGEAAADACGDLWAEADLGSGYEEYGGSCGERPGRDSFTCLSGNE